MTNWWMIAGYSFECDQKRPVCGVAVGGVIIVERSSLVYSYRRGRGRGQTRTGMREHERVFVYITLHLLMLIDSL